MEKNILCFGDSNTYGESPEGGGRYPREIRWTGLLQKRLGDGFHIIEEGLNGRTSVWEDPVEGNKCGICQLPTVVESHTPLDLLIIMLGTNDLKRRFSATATDIALGVERLVKTAQQIPNYTAQNPFQILLVSPLLIHRETFLGEVFGDRREVSRQLAPLYKAAAQRCGVHFLNIARYAEASSLDGLHFDGENHQKVAEAMEQKIKEILGETRGDHLESERK